MKREDFTIPQRSLPKQFGIPMVALRRLRDDQLVKGEDWIGGKTCLFSSEGIRKLSVALALPSKTADLVLAPPGSEKSQHGPSGEQRGAIKTPLVVFRCAPHIVNTRIIECHAFGEVPDPSHLIRVWVKPHLHSFFRPRQLIPAEHLQPYGVPGQWVYVAPGPPRRQL